MLCQEKDDMASFNFIRNQVKRNQLYHSMGNYTTSISYEDVQYAQGRYVIISTLPTTEQKLLIHQTTPCEEEIKCVELAISKKTPIVIYGKHTNDATVQKKYDQIKKLGGNAYVYPGGLFEWLLLQDIYGNDHFKTTSYSPPMDLIKYKPNNILNIL
jgi:hypothetical protein